MTSWYLTSESDSDEKDLLLLALAEQTTRKRLWVHDINKERKKYGEYHTLMRDLRNSPQRFFIYFRMPEACFDEILELIKEDITKQDTKYREAISAEERLAITLRFLAIGDSYKTISHSYRVGFSTVAHIVKQVCYYICSRLQSTYMPVPTRQIWEASANMFHERWQFPNCVGTIDGKHVTIKSPPNSGSNYFCYLKKFSIVLLAIVGPDYKFIGVDIGGYGKNCDGGILEESSMGQKLSNNSLNIPPPKPLLEQNIPTPHVLIGDEAFALKTYLMRPFPRRSAREDNSKDNYNYRLCRARRVVENGFGILAKKWRIYDRPLEIDVETSKLVVKTTCILHNYLICKKADTFLHLLPSPTTTVFVNFDVDVRRAANVPFQIRDRFVNYFNNNNMNNIPIATFIDVIKRTHNWKSPGTDNIHNYWYKKFSSIHPFLHNHLNTFIQSPHLLPSYITHGVTYMIPKDINDTINPAKYRPITCLQTIYKILTGCLSEVVYEHLTKNNILSEQQKGCRKNSQGCKEQLTIDAVTMNSAVKSKTDIHTMFIDYQKAFDSVPHSWLLNVLSLYKIHPTLKHFLATSMQNWQTILKINSSSSTVATEPIHIKRGIFQGDALSPLWFCMALNPLSHLLDKTDAGYTLTNNNTQYTLTHLMYMDDIKLYAADKNALFVLADTTQQFSDDICMSFGVDKCKILSVVKGKVQNNSYTLGSGQTIEPMDEQSTYKYLGFKQSRQIHQKMTKQELVNKFSHRLNLILKTNLNSKNTIKAINTFAIPILTYSFGIIRWSNTDIKKLQRTLNTSLTKHRKHHPKSSIHRLTLPRHEGGRGLIDIHNLHNKQILSLRAYFHNKSENSALHKHVTEHDTKLTPLNLNNKNTQNNEQLINTQEKIAAWSAKALHGRHRAYLSQPHVDKAKSNEWLKRGELFPETEGFMLAIQDQIIATRNYRKYIIKDPHQPTDLCRHCNTASETIQHITGACKSLAQTDYKHRHDQVAAIIHQQLAFKYKLINEMKPYYKYKPELILDNNNQKIYWDRTIITDKTIHFNRPDITLHDKANKTVYLIDIAIPNSHNIQTTISEKLSKYQDLAIEIKTQWEAQTVHIVPIVLSSTGIVPKSLIQSLNTLHMPHHTLQLLQKATILNTCRITRKFLTSSTISSTFSI